MLAGPEDSPEDPSDRLLREVVEYIEDQDEAPLRILGGVQEDPDLGFYASREELLADASRLCLTFLPKGQEWLREQVGWIVNGELFASPPLDHFARRPLTDEKRVAVVDGLQPYTRKIEDKATLALALFDTYAKEYVRSVERVPFDQPSPATKEEVLLLSKSHYKCTSYVRAGRWKYPIRFYSARYPDLEAVLNELQELRHERDSTLRRLVQ